VQVHLLPSQSTYPTQGRTPPQQFGGPVSHFSSLYIIQIFFQKVIIQEFFLLYISASAIHHYANQQFFILSYKRVKTNSHARRLVQPQVLSVSLVEHDLVVSSLPCTSMDLRARLTIVCSGIIDGISVVGVSTVGAAGLK
jgi:hypothetical protein